MINKIPDIKIFHGKKPGKTSIIMAGIHGNEVCGINAIKDIISNFSIESGTVIFIFGNPEAIKKNVRFIDFNLNRAFLPVSKYSKEIKKTYEYKKAQEIKKILNKSDALLDIHSTLNDSEPFIICEKNAFEITPFLPKEFKRIVYGLDSVEPGAVDGYMLSRGKIGICIECGQHNNSTALKIAKDAIFSFLNKLGHINNLKLKNIKNRENVQMNYIYYTKTNSFILAKKFYDFEKIKKGTFIGTDGKEKISAPYDCVIVFAHNRGKKNEEAFLLGKIILK